MSRLMLVFTVVVALSFQLSLVWSDCNKCQSNGVACINQTAYQFCFGGSTPNTDQTFVCPDGLVCTEHANICFQRTTQPASCGDTSSCGLCNSNYTFACTSLNTFSFCYGALTPSTVNGTCPTGLFCDASSADMCVSEATSDSIICHSTT